MSCVCIRERVSLVLKCTSATKLSSLPSERELLRVVTLEVTKARSELSMQLGARS